MQFQQNIFLFHRTITKLPRLVFIIGMAVVLLLFIYESAIALSTYSSYPVSSYQKVFIQFYEEHNKHYHDNIKFLENLKKKKEFSDKQKQKQSNNKLKETQHTKQGDKEENESRNQGKFESESNPKQEIQVEGQNNKEIILQTVIRAQQQQHQVINPQQQQASPKQNVEQTQQTDKIFEDKQESNQGKEETGLKEDTEKEKEQKMPWDQDPEIDHLQGLSKLVEDEWLLDIILTEDLNGEEYLIENEPPYPMSVSPDNHTNTQLDNVHCHLTYTDSLLSIPRNKDFQSKHNIAYYKLKIKPFKKPQLLFGNRQLISNQQLVITISSSLKLAQQTIRKKLTDQYLQAFPQPSEKADQQIPFPLTKNAMEKFNFRRISFYYHYGEFSHKLVLPQKYQSSLFGKPFVLLGIFCNFIVLSIFMGLFVRYGMVTILTIYMVLGGEGNFGWFQEYASMIRKRNRDFWKLFFWLCFGMVGNYTLLSYGAWWALTLLFQPVLSMQLHTTLYASQVVKILFFTELCHFLFMHTRTTIYFYSIMSSLLACLVIMLIEYNPFILSQYLLTSYVLFQVLLTLLMILIEKEIIEVPFHSEYKPTLGKPRMMFYIGYQLLWERGVPPMWTYFATWLDWAYIAEKEKVYLDRDYQLLYGMMLGMNQRQPLPEDQQQEIQLQQANPVQADQVSEMERFHQQQPNQAAL